MAEASIFPPKITIGDISPKVIAANVDDESGLVMVDYAEGSKLEKKLDEILANQILLAECIKIILTR